MALNYEKISRDVTRLWQKQAMPAPETTLPALKNFKMRQNLWKSEKFDLLTKSAIQTIFFFRSLILRRIEKKLNSNHNFQKNV